MYATLAHFFIFVIFMGLLYGCGHILSIKWRRISLVSKRLHLFHMGSGNVIIAWDM